MITALWPKLHLITALWPKLAAQGKGVVGTIAKAGKKCYIPLTSYAFLNLHPGQIAPQSYESLRQVQLHPSQADAWSSEDLLSLPSSISVLSG